MSKELSPIDFHKIALREVDQYNKAVENLKRDGDLPKECSFFEMNRRMEVIRTVGQCQNVLTWWKTISTVVETWADCDMLEIVVRVQQREASSSTSPASGGTSNGVFHVCCVSA
jgi:hypothetical protein